MQEIGYETFHLRNFNKSNHQNHPNTCQFELTFRCGLRCKHCCTDCYNTPELLRTELNTRQVKVILDKIHNSGVFWLCFTGGDPLTRKDFPDIYSYAKKKGFMITILTNSISLTETIANCLKKQLPFSVEITLNAVTKELYEKISQVKGSFEEAMRGLDLMLKAGLPLKIKTQVTKDNLKELPKVKKFLKKKGLTYLPSFDLYPRLNGDTSPCDLRISPEEVINLNSENIYFENNCLPNNRTSGAKLFRCALERKNSFHIDPYGNTFSCNLIRKPSYNLLKMDLGFVLNELLAFVKDKRFDTNSKCVKCKLMDFCRRCPGRVFLETGDIESPVKYYCELAERLGGLSRVK